MDEKTIMHTKVYKTIAIMTTILVILCGAFIIASALDIYLAEAQTPYSPEAVAERFRIAKYPIIITLFSIVCGGILHTVWGIGDKKIKSHVDVFVLCERQRARIEQLGCTDETASAIRAQISSRVIFRTVCYLAAAIFLLIAFFIAIFTEYTTENINGVVIKLFFLTLPLCLGAVASLILSSVLTSASAHAELLIEREFIASVKSEEKDDTNNEKHVLLPVSFEEKGALYGFYHFFSSRKKILKPLLQCAILAISVVFIILGITNGNMADILGKAVRICTECIGLG